MKELTPNTIRTALAAAIVVILVTVPGCQSERHKAQPAPHLPDVGPGSTFTVIDGFLIPDDQNSVYFQDAQLYPEGEIQADYPFCKFSSAAGGEIIHSGVLTVSNVEYDESSIGPKGGDVSATKIHLKQAATGKSYRMDCMLPLASHGARFVTSEEIQGALAGYMNLQDAP